MPLPFAHTVPYFKTGRSSPDKWIEDTKALLRKLGATEINEGFVSVGGRATFALSFRVEDDVFRVAWPVLPVKNPADELAAKIQAATFLYHECKARCLTATVLGVRSAFVGFLALPGGVTVMESSNALLAEHVKVAGFLNHQP